MTYLVDANILSEPTKPAPMAKVVRWLEAHEEDLVVDSVVLGELYLGVLTLPRGRRRERLEDWLSNVVETIDCLPWDAAVARCWADLVARLKAKGQTLPLLDSMIAATALAHGLTVATRNGRDFTRAGVEVIDPFA